MLPSFVYAATSFNGDDYRPGINGEEFVSQVKDSDLEKLLEHERKYPGDFGQNFVYSNGPSTDIRPIVFWATEAYGSASVGSGQERKARDILDLFYKNETARKILLDAKWEVPSPYYERFHGSREMYPKMREYMDSKADAAQQQP